MSRREDWADDVQAALGGALAPTGIVVANACLVAGVPEIVAFLLGWQCLPTTGMSMEGADADAFAASYAAGVTLRWRLRAERERLVREGEGGPHAA